MSLFRSISSFTKEDIKTLLKTARTKVITAGLTIKVVPKKVQNGRILIIIPRKSGNAPERNLLRRRLKAIFFEEKLYNEPYDCVIFAAPEAVHIPFSQLKELLINCIRP